jgi:hypothetical protein
LAFACGQAAFAQTITVTGFVKNKNSQEPLIDATLIDTLSKRGVTTNEHGYFSLSLPQGKLAILQSSYIGYAPVFISMVPMHDTLLTIELSENAQLQALEVSARLQDNPLLGKIDLPIERLNSIPSVGGERDILKALTLLPGVTVGAEGSSSIYVRGGSGDQNLFILDGTPIYNTGHLFNFFSLFNADAVKKIDFYKSAFPARFGGRLSSVLDINFREGNKKQFEGKVDIGFISSKILLETPLSKTGKTSLLFAARSSYLDLFTLGKEKKVITPGLSEQCTRNFTGYTFADVNLKINHEFNERNKIFLNIYTGKDFYRSANTSGLGININQNRNNLFNAAAALRSYHLLSSKLFLQFGLSYSQNSGDFKTIDKQYNFTITPPPAGTLLPPQYNFTLAAQSVYRNSSFIKDFAANARLDFTAHAKHTFRLGLDAIRHIYRPTGYVAHTEDFIDRKKDTTLLYPTQSLKATEAAVFVEDEIQISQKLKCLAGIRLSHFNFDKARFAIEPRLSLAYSLPQNGGTLNASLSRMQQYNHALIKAGDIVDKIVWVPSNAQAPPQYAWQYALAWRTILGQKKEWEISLEAYYKQMYGLSLFRVNYQDPAIYRNWQDKILSNGNGKAQGVEFYLAKTKGRLQGSVAYTLAWNTRQFEQLNEGKAFPFIYDRRHNFVATAIYDLSKYWKFSALWTISNGRRFNLPVAKVPDSPFSPEYHVYNQVNNAQLPVYHRLDIAFMYEKPLLKNRSWGASLNVYNLYSHRNAYYLYPDTDYEFDKTGKIIAQRESVKVVSLFPILPSLNLFYKF